MNWRSLLVILLLACLYAQAREWRSADGTRTLEGQFGGLKEGRLLLKDQGGKSLVHPLALFSKEDQEFAQKAQVTLEAAVKAGALNMQVDQVLPEGFLCRVVSEMPNQKGMWIAAGVPFLVLRSGDFTAERGGKVMARTLYHAGTRTFQALDGTSTLINAYSSSLDDAVNTALQIQIASGGDPTKLAPVVTEPLIETIVTRGFGLPVGKGFFITDGGLLKDAKSIAIHHDGNDVPAKVVRTDDKLGLVLLSSAVEMEQGKFLPRKTAELGQNIFAVALPLTVTRKAFAPPVLTKGIVSRAGEAGTFQQDAAAAEESVGGYVVGEKGDVLGVFFASLSRTEGKRSSTSSSDDANAAKGLTECIRGESLEKVLQDEQGKQLPGVPSLKSGEHGGELKDIVAALRRSSVLVVATREIAKAPPPPKAAGGSMPPAGGVVGNLPLSWSISSSGIRHNSNCRYFNAKSPCQAADGKPCKICGG